MKPLRKVGNFITTAWSLDNKWTKEVFVNIFAVCLLSFGSTGLLLLIFKDAQTLVNVWQESLSHISNPIGVLAILFFFWITMTPSMYFGVYVYDRFVGPRIRKKGWNEQSYLLGLASIPVFVFVLLVLPAITLIGFLLLFF